MSAIPKGHLGNLRLKTGVTQYNVPVYEAFAISRPNKNYPILCNAAANPSVSSRGMNTPRWGFRAPAKTSWLTAAFCNAAIVTLDGNSDSSAWNLFLNDGTSSGTYSDQKFDSCYWNLLRFQGGAEMPEVMVYGEGLAVNPAGSTSFSSFTLDPGSLIDYSGINFGSSATADLVRSFDINIVRPQGYDAVFNPGSYNPLSISSGMLGGFAILEQAANYTVTPGSTLTLRLGSTPLVCTLTVDGNGYEYPVRSSAPGFVRMFYRIANLSTGGVAVAFS